MGRKFPENTIVWAHMEEYPWWPSRVVNRAEYEKTLTLSEGEVLLQDTPSTRMVEFFNDNNRVTVLRIRDLKEYKEDNFLEETEREFWNDYNDVVQACKEAEDWMLENDAIDQFPEQSYVSNKTFSALKNARKIKESISEGEDEDVAQDRPMPDEEEQDTRKKVPRASTSGKKRKHSKDVDSRAGKKSKAARTSKSEPMLSSVDNMAKDDQISVAKSLKSEETLVKVNQKSKRGPKPKKESNGALGRKRSKLGTRKEKGKSSEKKSDRRTTGEDQKQIKQSSSAKSKTQKNSAQNDSDHEQGAFVLNPTVELSLADVRGKTTEEQYVLKNVEELVENCTPLIESITEFTENLQEAEEIRKNLESRVNVLSTRRKTICDQIKRLSMKVFDKNFLHETDMGQRLLKVTEGVQPFSREVAGLLCDLLQGWVDLFDKPSAQAQKRRPRSSGSQNPTKLEARLEEMDVDGGIATGSDSEKEDESFRQTHKSSGSEAQKPSQSMKTSSLQEEDQKSNGNLSMSESSEETARVKADRDSANGNERRVCSDSEDSSGLKRGADSGRKAHDDEENSEQVQLSRSPSTPKHRRSRSPSHGPADDGAKRDRDQGNGDELSPIGEKHGSSPAESSRSPASPEVGGTQGSTDNADHDTGSKHGSDKKPNKWESVKSDTIRATIRKLLPRVKDIGEDRDFAELARNLERDLRPSISENKKGYYHASLAVCKLLVALQKSGPKTENLKPAREALILFVKGLKSAPFLSIACKDLPQDARK